MAPGDTTEDEMPSRDCKGAVAEPPFPLPDSRGSDAVYFQEDGDESGHFAMLLVQTNLSGNLAEANLNKSVGPLTLCHRVENHRRRHAGCRGDGRWNRNDGAGDRSGLGNRRNPYLLGESHT